MLQTDERSRKAIFENAETIWQRRIQQIKNRKDRPEFPTGISQLDNFTHGFRRGELSFVAARTSEGKTAFALQSATLNTDLDKTVAYISLEDSREDLVERIFCNMTRTDNQMLLRGMVPQERLEDKSIMQIFSRLKLLLIDKFGYTIDEIKRIVDDLEPTPDLVFLDYIQAIEKPDKTSRYDAINKFADQLREYTLSSGIGFVTLTQINRAGAREDRPSLIHFSGSDVLEQRADKALILYQPYLYEKPTFDFESGKDSEGRKVVIQGYEVAPRNWVEIEIAKNKNGMRGIIIPTKFTGKHYLFEDWDGVPE